MKAGSGFTDNSLETPEYCVRVPRLLLSPCRLIVVDVGTEMSNRVLRKFMVKDKMGPCSFLRLQIGDETGKPMFGELSDEVQSRIKSVILQGIEVNSKFFQFLAYSSSRESRSFRVMHCTHQE